MTAPFVEFSKGTTPYLTEEFWTAEKTSIKCKVANKTELIKESLPSRQALLSRAKSLSRNSSSAAFFDEWNHYPLKSAYVLDEYTLKVVRGTLCLVSASNLYS